MSFGVIVASTHHLEWILPWWWYHFRLHNDLAVAFLDLGLTDKAKEWCQQRGELIPVEVPQMNLRKETVEPTLAQKWEQLHGEGMWDVRLKWMLKPFAFAKTPFSKTLWIDLDCEVREDLSCLFSLCDHANSIVIAREPELYQTNFRSLDFIKAGEIIYNSGVVVYKQDAPFLSKWIEEVVAKNALYLSDQDALSRLIFDGGLKVKELAMEYNWPRGLGNNPKAKIFHWYGEKGKNLILQEMQALWKLKLL